MEKNKVTGDLKLIEHYFPVKEITPIALSEKKGRPPIFELHYWWTRKPLAAIRPILLGAILPSDYDTKKYLKLCGIETGPKVQSIYKRNPSEDELKEIKSLFEKNDKRGVLFDPFCGGGSIAFESLRYNLPIIINDYNPLSWLILKSTLEYPQVKDINLLSELESSYNSIISELKTQLLPLYPDYEEEPVGAYLYCYIIRCQRCDEKIPLIGNWNLSSKKSAPFHIEPIIKKEQISYEIREGVSTRSPTCINGIGKCILCGEPISNFEIVRQFNRGVEEQLLAVITISPKGGKRYRMPRDCDQDCIQQAKKIFDTRKKDYEQNGILPTELMSRHTVRPAKYLNKWINLFNPRQLLVTAELALSLKKRIQDYQQKNATLAPVIGTYLSFLLGKMINRNCRITTWDRPGEKIMQACSNKLNAIQWDHSEINPFTTVSGCFEYGFDEIKKAIKFSQGALNIDPIRIENRNIMEITQESFPNLKNRLFSLIITDPPYYDDAPYAELSEFFFVWYQRILSGLYGNNPNFISAVTPKEGDLSVSHLRTGVEFGEKFISMCQKLNTLLEPNGMLVMFFAHPKVSTWNSVIKALIDGNFHVTATWPVSTESKGIANAKKKNSLLSSLIIIARKVSEQTGSHKKEYTWEEFAAEAKKRVHEEFARLSKEGFRKADLITVALGICFELLTDPLHRNNIIDSDNAIKFIEALTEKEKMK